MGSNINSVESQFKHKTMFPRVLMNIVHDLAQFDPMWPFLGLNCVRLKALFEQLMIQTVPIYRVIVSHQNPDL